MIKNAKKCLTSGAPPDNRARRKKYEKKFKKVLDFTQKCRQLEKYDFESAGDALLTGIAGDWKSVS